MIRRKELFTLLTSNMVFNKADVIFYSIGLFVLQGAYLSSTYRELAIFLPLFLMVESFSDSYERTDCHHI